MSNQRYQDRFQSHGLKEYIDRRMTIKHLRILTAIARYGKLSEAAHHLNTTTSNVSKTLKEIDEFIGERLFVRNSGQFKETAISRQLLKLANDIFSAMELAKDGLDQHDPLAPNVAIKIGYYRTLMSSRAHALWNKLVLAERGASVMLNRLTPQDLQTQEVSRHEYDIILSSNDLRAYLHAPEWHIITRPLQEMVFMTSEEYRNEAPRNFFLPACSESVTQVLTRYVMKFFPDHDAISYYDSLHSVLEVLAHPGTCIIAERADGQRIAQSMPLRVIQSMDHHGLHYQAAINVHLLRNKGILKKAEQLIQDMALLQ